MLFQKMAQIENPIKANTYFTNLNNNIYDAVESNECIEDFLKLEYVVDSEESMFELPRNYNDNSVVEVYIDNVETVAYTIIEQNLVNCIQLNSAISSGTVLIKCKNFKKGFLKKLIEIVQDNTPVG